MEVRPETFIVTIPVILVALGIHEFAHAKVADMSGDPTPRIHGRVTLNLFNHLDPMGTLMIVLTTISGFGIGWGRPVPMDPRRMRNPRWDHFWAVAAGPISNLIQAAVFAILLRLMLVTGIGQPAGLVGELLLTGVFINLALCLFNLLPLGPLDGHWLLGSFLPEQSRFKWYLWNRQMGGILLLGLVFLGQLDPRLSIIGAILRPAVMGLASFLLGINLT